MSIDNEPSDDRICEVATTDAGVGWCRICGAEAEHVEPDGKGYRCKLCSAMAVDGVAVWLFERTGETKWEEALNKHKAAILVATTDAGVGWCRICGAEAEHVEPDGKGYRCKLCSAMAVDGVAVWLFERTGETKWEEALNKHKAAILARKG